MSHQVYFNQLTGKHSIFSVNEIPWHGLGQIVDKYPTSAEALKFAGLDFEVEKRKLFTYDSRNQFSATQKEIALADTEVKNQFATVRTDTDQVLGIVGKDYQIIQNVDAFSFFDSIVGGGEGILYETAGALGEAGERIFITAKLPGYIQVGAEDCVEKYLFLTTSHDGFGSITAAFTPVRVCCHNTLNAALRNCTNMIKIRHTQKAKERLDQAHKLMQISNRLSDELESIFQSWSKVRINDEEVKKLIRQAMAPNKETIDKMNSGKEDELSTVFNNMCTDVFEYMQTHDTQQTELTKGTVWGFYNGVTGYFQNVRKYKTDEAKLDSILFGGVAQQRTQTAFNLAMRFSGN